MQRFLNARNRLYSQLGRACAELVARAGDIMSNRRVFLVRTVRIDIVIKVRYSLTHSLGVIVKRTRPAPA